MQLTILSVVGTSCLVTIMLAATLTAVYFCAALIRLFQSSNND
jgi:hypothetical protein